MTKRTQPVDAIKLAERMLGLLDRGSFVATYKYAVLLGLMSENIHLSVTKFF